MKIIIVGCGKVGTALTAQLSREDNLVTVIDTDSIVVRNVSNTYDVMGIVETEQAIRCFRRRILSMRI